MPNRDMVLAVIFDRSFGSSITSGSHQRVEQVGWPLQSRLMRAARNCARTCSGALFWVVQDSEDEMRFKPSPRACAQFVAIGGLLSMMRPAIAQVVPPSNSTAAWSIVSRLTAGQEVRVNMTT